MRGKGISYDTGWVLRGQNSRELFEPEQVERDLTVIRDDLHCTTVRIMGGDPGRIETAARYAAQLGLEVWFSPYPLDLTTDEMLDLFAECADRAERLRTSGTEVVFVTGAELSLMALGFLPGANTEERVAALLSNRQVIPGLAARINEFLGRAVKIVRERFGGPVTYASVQLEQVDWTPFDIISVDLYRSKDIVDQFAAGVRILAAGTKPVAVTEFGTASYRDAGDLGAQGMQIVENDESGTPVKLKGVYERDEAGQGEYLRELLEIFDRGGMDTAFVFTFALSSFPHRPDGDPRDDLDLASYGIVRVREDGTWEPKEAFRVVGDFYSSS
jgi:hypothetical protein